MEYYEQIWAVFCPKNKVEQPRYLQTPDMPPSRPSLCGPFWAAGGSGQGGAQGLNEHGSFPLISPLLIYTTWGCKALLRFQGFG